MEFRELDMYEYFKQMQMAMNIVSSIVAEVNKLDPAIFTALIGSLSDEYEAKHEDFSTVEMFEMMSEISKQVHNEIGRIGV